MEFSRKETQTEEARINTRRGRLLTTLPRIIQMDVLRIKTPRERKELLGTDDFNIGTNLQLLKIKAENKTKWDKIVQTMTKYEELIWQNRNQERKRSIEDRRNIENNTTKQTWEGKTKRKQQRQREPRKKKEKHTELTKSYREP